MPTHTTPIDLSGVWVPLITPFLDEPHRPVDHASLARLCAHLQAQGVKGLVIGGTTGEASALSADERLACWRTVAAHAPCLPLMLGCGGHSLADALTDMARLRDGMGTLALPLHSVLLAAPPYIRPSTEGLCDWFETLASAAPAPLVVYDIPYRTGSVLPRETLLRLAGHPRICGVKDCGGDSAKTLALLHDGRLQVLAGEDLQVMAHLAHGGPGCISASAHLYPERWVRLLAHWQKGELQAARTLWRGLVPLIEQAFSEPNPAPVKAALELQGWVGSAVLRRPMTAASEGLRARWTALGLSRP